MSTARQRFERVISKGVRDHALVEATLNQAETILPHLNSVISRYFSVWQSPTIPIHLLSEYREVSERMIHYGFFTHFTCFGSERRARFREVNLEGLCRAWFEMAGPALGVFTTYNKRHLNVPEIIFSELYGLEFESLVRNSGMWWWKRMRIQTAIRDQFATGITLGMSLDSATAQLSG